MNDYAVRSVQQQFYLTKTSESLIVWLLTCFFLSYLRLPHHKSGVPGTAIYS